MYKSLFSKLSFIFSILTILLFICLYNLIPSIVKAGEDVSIPPIWLIVVTKISWISGLICSIISLVRKERLKYLKFIGIVINFLILDIIILVQIILPLMVCGAKHR